MSKQIVQIIDEKNIKGNYLKYLIEYRNSLLLYSNGEVLFHDEEGCDLINKSNCSKGRKSFRGSKFDIHEKNFFNGRKSVNQILCFNKPYFMIKDNHPNSLFAIRDNKSAFVFNDVLVPGDYKKRYMDREELEKYLSSSSQLIRYEDSWTREINIPTNEEILDSFKGYVISNYVNNQGNDELKEILTPIVLNSSIETISRDYVIMPQDILLIKDDMTMTYLTVKYEGVDWFMVESRNLPITKHTLSEVKESITSESIVDESKFNIRLARMKNIKNKKIVKNM